MLRLGNRAANSASISSILLLAATCNAQLEVQASGAEEDRAIRAAEVFFQSTSEEGADRGSSEFSASGRPENERSR